MTDYLQIMRRRERRIQRTNFIAASIAMVVLISIAYWVAQ